MTHPPCFEVGHIMGDPEHRFFAFPASLARKVVKPLSQDQYMLIEFTKRTQIKSLASLLCSLLTADERDHVILEAEIMEEETVMSQEID